MYLASAAAKKWSISASLPCKRELKGNKTGQKHNKQLLQFFPQYLVLGVCLCRTFCLGSCVTAQRILMGQPSFKGSTSFRRSAGRNLSLRKRKGLYMSLHVLTHGLAVHETSLCEATNPRLSMLPKGYSVCIPLRFLPWQSGIQSLYRNHFNQLYQDARAMKLQHIASANLA